MAIKHERLGMRRNLAFWLVSSILLLSISKHAIQSLDFTRKKRKLIAATTSLRFVEFRSSGITDEFVFLLSFSISSRIKGTRILFLPFWKDRDFQRSAHLSFHFFFSPSFFLFFFPSPSLSFLANIDPFQPRRVFETSDIMVDIVRIVVSGLNFNIPLL